MIRKSSRARWLWMLSLVSILSLVAAACGGDDDDTAKATTPAGATTKGFTDAGYKAAGFKTFDVAAGGTIKIGISSALSGDVKGLGEPIADSAAVAADGVTIKGFKIEIVKEDDLCTPEGGPAAADRLIKAGVIAVVGPICSGGTRASLAAYDKAGITHISPSATAGDLSSPQRAEGPYVTFFRVPTLNFDEAQAQATYMKDTLKLKKVFVVFDTDDYGKDLSTQFQTFWKAGGGTIVGQASGYEKKTTDFKAVISSIKQAKPDAIYFAGFYAEATPFLQQLRADGDTKKLIFMGSDGVKNDELITGAKDAANDAYLALPGEKGPEFSKYAAKYKIAESATFGPEAYDAMTAILKALEAVAKVDGGKLTIDGKALNDAILKSNFAGASGTIKFKSNGDRDGAAVQLFQIKAGKYEAAKK